MLLYQQLQSAAIAISILSIVYNAVEGGVSIGLAADINSKSLLFFGVQSLVEVLSAILVVYRFRHIVPPGEESNINLSPDALRLEKHATLGIGFLFIILAGTTWTASSLGLSMHQTPNTALPVLIVSSSALMLMIAIWIPKVYLYKRLNSSAEADCSLACVALTVVLLGGSIIYRFWKGGWWVDGAVALVLGMYFAEEGVRMVRWARNPNFNGGCCGSCSISQPRHNRCDCCREKQACKEADRCMCARGSEQEQGCSCLNFPDDGLDCCQRALQSQPTVAARACDQGQLDILSPESTGDNLVDRCHCCS